MLSAVQVGDVVDLPSGRSVQITLPCDASRPWLAVPLGSSWCVSRYPSPTSPDCSPYSGGEQEPLALSEDDARLLALLLNRVA